MTDMQAGTLAGFALGTLVMNVVWIFALDWHYRRARKATDK